jgi:hypothetical protein
VLQLVQRSSLVSAAASQSTFTPPGLVSAAAGSVSAAAGLVCAAAKPKGYMKLYSLTPKAATKKSGLDSASAYVSIRQHTSAYVSIRLV